MKFIFQSHLVSYFVCFVNWCCREGFLLWTNFSCLFVLEKRGKSLIFSAKSETRVIWIKILKIMFHSLLISYFVCSVIWCSRAGFLLWSDYSCLFLLKKQKKNMNFFRQAENACYWNKVFEIHFSVLCSKLYCLLWELMLQSGFFVVNWFFMFVCTIKTKKNINILSQARNACYLIGNYENHFSHISRKLFCLLCDMMLQSGYFVVNLFFMFVCTWKTKKIINFLSQVQNASYLIKNFENHFSLLSSKLCCFLCELMLQSGFFIVNLLFMFART